MAEIKPNLDGEKKGKLDNDSGRNKKKNPFFKCKNQNYNRKPSKKEDNRKIFGNKKNQMCDYNPMYLEILYGI